LVGKFYFSGMEISREELELRLYAMFENAVDGIITIDPRGIIESTNQSASQLFGFERHEMVGNNITMLMPSPFRELHDTYIAKYLETGHKKIIGIGREVQGKRKNGTVFPFWLSVNEIQIEGQIIFTGFVHDITELKKAEQEVRNLNSALESKVSERTEQLADVVNRLLAANKKLEREVYDRQSAEQALQVKQEELVHALEREKELSELKSRFVSMASHEFRTPLATIQSSAALVRRYAETTNMERLHFHLEKIRSTVNNLTSILNDFLSLTKLEEGKVENRPETFDLHVFCHETIEEVRGLTKPGQEIMYVGPDETHLVFLDPRLLRNILYNLLSNAIKYSSKNITLESHFDDNTLILHVIDQGVGIPEAEKQHLFDRFFRASNVTNIQGVGLGMDIVKRYLQIMGGDISFESEEGKGSTFTVIFHTQVTDL
jgi:PAS domain S-box-containing protein